MTRREWTHLRRGIIREARSCCMACGKICLGGNMDVVLVVAPSAANDSQGTYVAFCRSCRVKRQSPAAQAKAQATKRARRAQLRLPLTRSRSRAA